MISKDPNPGTEECLKNIYINNNYMKAAETNIIDMKFKYFQVHLEQGMQNYVVSQPL